MFWSGDKKNVPCEISWLLPLPWYCFRKFLSLLMSRLWGEVASDMQQSAKCTALCAKLRGPHLMMTIISELTSLRCICSVNLLLLQPLNPPLCTRQWRWELFLVFVRTVLSVTNRHKICTWQVTIKTCWRPILGLEHEFSSDNCSWTTVRVRCTSFCGEGPRSSC